MKKSAGIFILLTTIISACSTSKSSSVTTNQQTPTTDANTQTVVKQAGKNIPVSEAKMLKTMPKNSLARKKSDKTMEQSFDAAGVRDSL